VRLRPRSVRARTTIAGLSVLGVVFAAILALFYIGFLAADAPETRNSERLAAMVVGLESGLSPERLVETIEVPVGIDSEVCEFAVLNEDRSPVFASLDSELLGGPEGIVYYGRLGAPFKQELASYTVANDAGIWKITEAEALTPPGNLLMVLDVCPDFDTRFDDSLLIALLPVPIFAWLILMGIGGTAFWWASRRALNSVEEVRLEVEELSLHNLNRRVSVPETGDELASLATTMNSMLGRLETASARQRQFVDDASHELRSPLTNLRTQLEVGKRHPDRVDPAQTYSGALVELDRADNLIADLLTLARLDQGSAATSEGSAITVAEIAEQLRASTGANSIDFQIEEAVSAVEVPRLVGMAVRNLVDNAAIYGNSAPKVTIGHAAQPGGSQLVFTVIDDGPGIAAEDRQRVLRRFERLDESRNRATGGTGLGLAIANEITTHLGGTLSIGDRLDGASGARVELVLPLH